MTKPNIITQANRIVIDLLVSQFLIVFQFLDMLVFRIYRLVFLSRKILMRGYMKKTQELNKFAEKAKYILEKGDLAEYIMEQYQKLHIGDNTIGTVLLLSIVSSSILNSKGIQVKLSGESGKGKTHCCDAMKHLMPPEWIIKATLSDKAIYRMEPKPGTIIYSDDDTLSDDFEDTLKRAMTNFQEPTYYNTLDKNNESDPKYITERLVWWLTSVDNIQSEQLLNRLFILNVDESPEQNQRVHDIQVKRRMTGKTDLQVTEEVAICREIIGDIKRQTFTVLIPFADRIEWPYIDDRRLFDMFSDVICAFTVLRYRQRKTDATGALIATEDDFWDAIALFSSMGSRQRLKTTKKEEELIEAVINLDGSATYKQLCERLEIGPSRLSQILNGKGNDSGLLNKVPELSIEKEDKQNLIVLDKSYQETEFNVKLRAV